MSRPMPRTPAPALQLPLLDGSDWDLHSQSPERFSLLVFYRGLHCPKCRLQLQELTRTAAEFAQFGIAPIAISSDTPERAAQARDEWELSGFPIAHSLSIEQARDWGLYISSSRGKTSLGIEEPALFSEPGLFLIQPDGTLYAAMIQTMPFARPLLRELLATLPFIIDNDYPARGEA